MSEEQADYLADAKEMMGWDKPKEIITEISGFVPVFDCVLERYGNAPKAIVHGAMYRFCQMEDRVCKASLSTIGKMVGLDKATVMRYAKELCDDGYFADLTPGLKNRPHVYADTGKVVMRSKIHVAQNNTGVAQNNATVAENQLNKVLNKDTNKPKKGDLVDGWLHFQKEGQKNNLKNIQDRAESALMRLQYNMVGTKATERDRFLRFLKAEEEQGRTIEQWVEWCFADGFWPGKLSSVHKVMELWPRAFSQPEVIDKRHEL